MEFSASSSGVVDSNAGEVAEDLVVPQKNRPWKYIPQFSDEKCRLIQCAEDRTEEDRLVNEEEEEDYGEGGGSTGDGLLQYYRHKRALEEAVADRDLDDDLNGDDLEVIRLSQVVYGRGAPPGGQPSTDEVVHEDPVVPVRLERRSQMDANWPTEGEDLGPRGNGLTSGVLVGPWGNEEEGLIEGDVEQLQWRSFSSGGGAESFPYQDLHPSSAEEYFPAEPTFDPPSDFANFPPSDDFQYSPEKSHEIEKDEALWNEINVKVAESMATAAILSSETEPERVERVEGDGAEPIVDVTLHSESFVPLECTADSQFVVDGQWPVTYAEVEKDEGVSPKTREEDEFVEEPFVEARLVSQTYGGVPEFSPELELGQGPSEPEVELRGEVEPPRSGSRSIIETPRTSEVHQPEVVQGQLDPHPSSQEEPLGSEDSRGRSKEPRHHQGGTLPPSGIKKPEKVPPRSRRSRSESFFGFLTRRKSKSKEPEDGTEEVEGDGDGGGKEQQGLKTTSSSAKTTPTISRSKDEATTGSEVKVKKSKGGQGQSFFEKLGFGRTSKKSEKTVAGKSVEERGGKEEKKRREAEEDGGKKLEREDGARAATLPPPQKQTSATPGSKTNIRIFEILAKNGDHETKDAEAGDQDEMLKSSHLHHQQQQQQQQQQEIRGRDVLTDKTRLGGFDPGQVERSFWDGQLDGGHPVAETGASAAASSTDAAAMHAMDARKKFIVAVAIDFGTAFSGYAFCFLRDPDAIHMMGRWEDGDPGVINQKTPTTLLLNPQGQFHSFGFTARNNYHDLNAEESKQWLYFDRFKMALYENQNSGQGLTIEAANGERFSGVDAISMTLRFFRDHALEQISSQSETRILNDDVLWIVTVPAIWNAPAKQLMRIAAYKAELASPDRPDQLLVALEPEAASVHIRRLQLRHLVPEKPIVRPLSVRGDHDHVDPATLEFIAAEFNHVVRYMVVDCGGGTVDITVHELNSMNQRLQEIHIATGGPHGSFAIDRDFERLLGEIFGADFIDSYRRDRPSGWVGLMMAFESRKRAADPRKTSSLNVAFPFSFIEYYRKTKGSTVDAAIRGYGDSGVRWSSQGMLRLTQDAMKKLFRPTLNAIKDAIENVLSAVKGIDYIFLVGGLSESAIFQCDVREHFKERVRKVIIPQEANLAVIKGAVVFGLDPAVISIRRSKLTYGAAVLNRFIRGQHPDSKLVVKDGVEWCRDVFDVFVSAGQVVRAGETVVRQYIPAAPTQTRIVIGIYCTDQSNPGFVSDAGVRKCANVSLDLASGTGSGSSSVGTGSTSVPLQQTSTRRRIEARLVFAETEIKVTATDTTTGKQVDASIDFLNV